MKGLESTWFVRFSGKSLPVLAARIFKNIHEIPSLHLGKTLSLEFHEYSRIFERPIPAKYFKLIQAVEIPWIFENIQAHKSWKFLEIPSSIFLQLSPFYISPQDHHMPASTNILFFNNFHIYMRTVTLPGKCHTFLMVFPFTPLHQLTYLFFL